MRTQISAQIVSRMAMSQVGGFTLLEMMTVLVIGGILAAISAPYFLSRAAAARQAEGKMLVSTLNRAQQAFYTQNAKFSPNVDGLALSLTSKNYTLVTTPSADGQATGNFATSKYPTLRSYVGMTAVTADATGNQTMQSILCEAQTPGAVPATVPAYSAAGINCAAGTQPWK